MIIEGVANLGLLLINAIVSALDLLPDLPASFVGVLEDFFDLIFGNLGLLGFFVPLTFLKDVALISLVVINFRHVYAAVMWVLRKIPMLSIE